MAARILPRLGRHLAETAVGLALAPALGIEAGGRLIGPVSERLAPAVVAAQPVATCAPTRPDALGPFYIPDAPLRASVGSGYVLAGTVRAAESC